MSLKSISLRDFVIVRELDLDLAQGFTVLTGETGAGKSILIDALQLVLGARADAGVVREGAARCDISAEFDSPDWLAPWLEQAGFEASDTLLLRRTIDTQGKSRAWINGSAATATQLKEIGEPAGGYSWPACLAKPDAARGRPRPAGCLCGYSTEALSLRWQQWRQAQKTLAQAQGAQDSLQRDRERLAWQIGELGKLAPGAHEWEELNAQHGRLSNIQALREAVQTAVDALQEADENAISLLGRAINALQNQEHIEPEFKGLTEVLNTAWRKWKTPCIHCAAMPGMPSWSRSGWPNWMNAWPCGSAWRVATSGCRQNCPNCWPPGRLNCKSSMKQPTWLSLKKPKPRHDSAYLREASQISGLRSKSAPRWPRPSPRPCRAWACRAAGSRLCCMPAGATCPARTGTGRVSGRGPWRQHARPVGKVASGGELSRIALAIAVTTSQLGQAQTLIFDEVDSGVGGAVAETVGRLMRQLGRDRQVLAVTHLPQVAACADQHLVVAKRTEHSATRSTVEHVAGEQRVAEIARMLGGGKLSGTTLAHAKEMLLQCG